MSTTTVSYRSTARDIEMAALRRREAEAREAQRRAARLAEQERRREEAVQRRIAAANRAINDEESRFQGLVAQLDAAARRLPDLALTAPQLPALTSEIARDPAALERHATRLAAEVQQFSSRLHAETAMAEQRLQRRIAKATAWREAKDLAGQLDLRRQANSQAAALLNEAAAPAAILRPPSEQAELEEVERHVAALRAALADENERHRALVARQGARSRAAALGGTTQRTQSADSSLARYEADRREAARTALQNRISTALAATGQRLDDLTGTTRILIDSALEQAHEQDQGERVVRWIARERAVRDGIDRALALMNCPPDLVHADQRLSQRWMTLVSQLQRVASGLDASSPSLEREYEQIAADARCARTTAFTRADWIRAMSEQGFEVLEGENGSDLVVVDMDHPDIWLEVTEVRPDNGRDGGFGTILELKTDAKPAAGAQDAAAQEAVTADICAKLAKVAEARGDVTSTTEVIERKSRIARDRRPARARRSLKQAL